MDPITVISTGCLAGAMIAIVTAMVLFLTQVAPARRHRGHITALARLLLLLGCLLADTPHEVTAHSAPCFFGPWQVPACSVLR